MSYTRIPRQQILHLLGFIDIWHDALICHSDGSFTIRCGYVEGSQLLQERIVSRLTKYTRATILKTREVQRGRDRYVEVRLGFPESQD